MAMHNRRKVDDKDLNRPKLKRNPGTGPSDGDGKGKGDEDERPTLKRRPA